MEKRFVVPAGTFIAGVLLWVVYLVLDGTRTLPSSPLAEVGVAVLAGALLVFSAARCRAAGGPRLGNVVRAVVLLAMAASAVWRLGSAAAVVLVIAAVATGALALATADAGKRAPTSA